MSYPPQPDPYGSQSGPYSGQQYPSGQYPTGNYPTGGYPQGGSEDFWRQVAGSQPPMPPKKKSTGMVLGLVGGGVAVLAVITLVVVMIINVNSRDKADQQRTVPAEQTTSRTSESGSGSVTAGDCIGLLDERGGEMTEETCGTLDSDYQVVKVANGTDRSVCGDDYSNVIDGKTYCIVLDVEVGDCITPYSEASDRIPLKLDCAVAEDQITRVAPRGEPAQVCGEGDGYYTFAEKTFCFNNVRGA